MTIHQAVVEHLEDLFTKEEMCRTNSPNKVSVMYSGILHILIMDNTDDPINYRFGISSSGLRILQAHNAKLEQRKPSQSLIHQLLSDTTHFLVQVLVIKAAPAAAAEAELRSLLGLGLQSTAQSIEH